MRLWSFWAGSGPWCGSIEPSPISAANTPKTSLHRKRKVFARSVQVEAQLQPVSLAHAGNRRQLQFAARTRKQIGQRIVPKFRRQSRIRDHGRGWLFVAHDGMDLDLGVHDAVIGHL